VQFAAVPVVAFLALQLVPITPFGSMLALGSDDRRSGRGHGLVDQASRAGESTLAGEPWSRRGSGSHPLRFGATRGGRIRLALAAGGGAGIAGAAAAGFSEIWQGPYLPRTMMLILFNIFQAVGFLRLANWVPTLLISRESR